MKILITENQYDKIIKNYIYKELSRLVKLKFNDYPRSTFWAPGNSQPHNDNFELQLVDHGVHYVLYVSRLITKEFSNMFPNKEKIIRLCIKQWIDENISIKIKNIYYDDDD